MPGRPHEGAGSNRKRPAKVASAVDTAEEKQPIWLARRPNESEVLVCATHLMADNGLRDAAPAAEGICALCTELVLSTTHAVERWLERVGGRNATQAGMQILEFVASAFTPATPPNWLHPPPAEGAVLLLNARYNGIALVKRHGTRGAGFDTAIIATVLTSAGPDA